MKKIIIFLLFGFAVNNVTNAQIKSVSGYVTDETNNKLQYVSVGIRDKNIGVVTEKDGFFKILIPVEYKDDTLTFSSVGYYEKDTPIRDLGDSEHLIHLVKKPLVMDTVTVVTKRKKPKTFGVKGRTPLLSGFVKSEDNYFEFAQLIKISSRFKILDIDFFLYSRHKDSVTVLVNFYEVGEDGLPGKIIFDKKIINRIKLTTGRTNIPVTEYNIYFDKPFFVAVEIIPDDPEIAKTFGYSYGARLGGKVYARSTSLGKWEVEKGGSITLYITAEQM